MDIHKLYQHCHSICAWAYIVCMFFLLKRICTAKRSNDYYVDHFHPWWFHSGISRIENLMTLFVNWLKRAWGLCKYCENILDFAYWLSHENVYRTNYISFKICNTNMNIKIKKYTFELIITCHYKLRYSNLLKRKLVWFHIGVMKNIIYPMARQWQQPSYH